MRATRDRWMVSYADMVTLLFACFAALYASALVPTQAESGAPVVETRVDAASESAEAREDLRARMLDALAEVDPSGDVAVTVDARGVVVTLPEAGTFAVGQADLTQAARRLIRALADTLDAHAGDIRIEGHSDDQPIATSRFASNWDLSAARATEVIRFLLAQTAINPARLSAAGYGEFRPLVPNDSDINRARNRRVEMVVGIGHR